MKNWFNKIAVLSLCTALLLGVSACNSGSSSSSTDDGGGAGGDTVAAREADTFDLLDIPESDLNGVFVLEKDHFTQAVADGTFTLSTSASFSNNCRSDGDVDCSDDTTPFVVVIQCTTADDTNLEAVVCSPGAEDALAALSPDSSCTTTFDDGSATTNDDNDDFTFEKSITFADVAEGDNCTVAIVNLDLETDELLISDFVSFTVTDDATTIDDTTDDGNGGGDGNAVEGATVDLDSLDDSDIVDLFTVEQDHFTQNVDADGLTLTNDFSFSNNCRSDGDPAVDCGADDADFAVIIQCTKADETIAEAIACSDAAQTDLAELSAESVCTTGLDDGSATAGTEVDDFVFEDDLVFDGVAEGDTCRVALVDVDTTGGELLILNTFRFTVVDGADITAD